MEVYCGVFSWGGTLSNKCLCGITKIYTRRPKKNEVVNLWYYITGHTPLFVRVT